MSDADMMRFMASCMLQEGPAPSVETPLHFLLPHRVVYGCYPDANAVRLIFNVEAVASHFEKSLVQDLLPAMSQEMREAPARIIMPRMTRAPRIPQKRTRCWYWVGAWK